MMSPVSSINFGNNVTAQTLIHREGKFARKPSQQVAPSKEKPQKSLSTLTKTLIGLAIVALGTAAYLGYAVKNGKLQKVATPEGITDKLKNIGFAIGEKVKNWSESFMKLFKKNSDTPTNSTPTTTTT